MKGPAVMNDLYLLEPEFRYHAERAQQELRAVRNRRWRRRLKDGRAGATNEKNWIS
jgi:hypothetical protein